jgi:hypothetical protein
MSIGSIGSSVLAPFFAVNSGSLAKTTPSGATATAPIPSPATSAEVTGLTAQESHLVLRIRTRSSVHTSDDGTVSERISSKLQFHYDLTTADGEHIELNVKAKLQHTSIQDADGNYISKTQLKLQFSLLQEGVADGLSPLLSHQAFSPSSSDTAPDVSAPSGVGDGLQAFLDAVDEALQQFTEGSNNSADDLLHKTVDAFNSLLGALSHLLFPPGATPAEPTLPPSSEPPSPVEALPAPLPPIDDDSPPADSPAANLAPTPAPAPIEQTPEEPIATDDVASEPPPSETGESETAPAESAPATAPPPTATQILRDVRIRFIQSLTQIIGTLTPPDQPGTGSLATSQYLSYQSSLSIRIHSASLVDATA